MYIFKFETCIHISSLWNVSQSRICVEYVDTVCQCEKGKAYTVGDECGKRRCHPPTPLDDGTLFSPPSRLDEQLVVVSSNSPHKFVLTTQPLKLVVCSLMPKSYMITTTKVLFLFLFNYVLKTCCWGKQDKHKTITACRIDRLLFLNLQPPPSPPACVFLCLHLHPFPLAPVFILHYPVTHSG